MNHSRVQRLWTSFISQGLLVWCSMMTSTGEITHVTKEESSDAAITNKESIGPPATTHFTATIHYLSAVYKSNLPPKKNLSYKKTYSRRQMANLEEVFYTENDCSPTSTNKINNDDSYDVDKFLETALGSEMVDDGCSLAPSNSTDQFSDSNSLLTNKSGDNQEVIDLPNNNLILKINNTGILHGTTVEADDTHENNVTPVSHSEQLLMKPSDTFQEETVSSLGLDETNAKSDSFDKSRTLSQYRTFTKHSQGNISQKHKPMTFIFPSLSTYGSKLQIFDDLLQEESILKLQTCQASRALDLCRLTKGLNTSNELVEAERVLLVTMLKQRAVIGAVNHFDHFEQQPQRELQECATISFTDIVLPLKQDFLASNENNGCILFPGSIHLTNLDHNSKINLEVYSLWPKSFTSHKSKIQLPQIFKRKNNATCTINPVEHESGSVHASSFKLAGTIEFTVQDLLYNNGPWHLKKIPLSSRLDGTVHMSLKTTSLELLVKHYGLLSMATLSGGMLSWEVLWFQLSEHFLRYWKYPCDQEENKPPVGFIDLRECLTTQIGPVHRSLCARKLTFIIETEKQKDLHDSDSILSERKKKLTVIRHLLSTSSIEEFREWCQKLSYVAHILSLFKCENNNRLSNRS